MVWCTYAMSTLQILNLNKTWLDKRAIHWSSCYCEYSSLHYWLVLFNSFSLFIFCRDSSTAHQQQQQQSGPPSYTASSRLHLVILMPAGSTSCAFIDDLGRKVNYITWPCPSSLPAHASTWDNRSYMHEHHVPYLTRGHCIDQCLHFNSRLTQHSLYNYSQLNYKYAGL